MKGVSVATMADSMLSMRRYVAPRASATPRDSTDLPEPGSPANTTRSVTQARYRPAPSSFLLLDVVPVLRDAAVLAGPDHLLEVAGQVAHVELGDALVPHVRFQAGGVQARPQQPLGQLHADLAPADDALRHVVAGAEQLVGGGDLGHQPDARSEERRVGKGGRSSGGTGH